MKSINIFFIFLFLFQHSGNAQGINQLYGQTPYGGIENGGIIFTTNSAGGNFQTRYDFRIGTNAGAEPWYTRLAEYNGKFYGMTLKGGLSNNGVIFEFDPVTNIYTKKIDFTGANGSLPYGSLVLSGTKFYGMTSAGGTSSKGVLFEWDPSTNAYTVKYNFNLNGETPYGNVTVVGGMVYGMTRYGGSGTRGVIFQFDPSTNIYTKKIDFSAATGSYPQSSLTHSNGIFYGVTLNGGINDLGTIFQWDPVTNIYTKKFDFATSSNGNYPIGSMTEYAGKFYGMTYDGGVISGGGNGVIYEWDPVSNIYTMKSEFTTATGKNPSGELTLYNNKFYGLTLSGGSMGGTIFEWDPTTNTIVKKIDLGDIKGGAPSGTLVLSGTKMFGLTKSGGADLLGTLFEWDPATNIFTKRYDFGGKDDKFPTGTLTPANGKLYGACTKGGGINSIGLLFEWDPATRTYTREYSFSGPDGRNPNSSLTYFNNKFYGMTTFGGAQDSGVIFEWDPAANIYTKKIDLSAATGTLPYGDLVAYNNKLYGMTSTGNAGNTGTIFEWDPATNIIIKKIDFTGPTGYQPYGSLALFNNKFYGTTTTGGPFPNLSGTIFEWDPATNNIEKKIDFSPANGYLSYGTLRLVNNLFYGVTYFGGANGAGVLFEYDPTANTYTLKYDFLNTTGSNPQAGVTYSDGKLYGITRNGGSNNKGVVFEWNPASNVYSKKYDFANFSPTLYYNNYLLNIPAYIGNGVVNTCSNVPSITINSSNNNIWVPITDLMGDAIGEINANGNNLGLVNVSLYVHNGPARSDGNNKFLNRNISINCANAPGSPVGIRLYIRKSEADSLIATPGSGATQINDIRLYRSSNLCQSAIPNLVDSIPSTIENWMGGYVYNASVAGFSTFYFTSKNYLPPACLVNIANNNISAAVTSVCGIVNTTLITGSTPTGGNGNYQYEWEKSIDNTNFSPISGANSKDYTAINIGQSTYFRRKVLSGSCVSVSSVVTINYSPIPPTPSITAGTTTTFCIGASVTLTSNAPNGNQWYKDGIAIGGATATTLNVTTSGSYTTIVTLNGCSSPASNATVVTVNPIPPAPTITAGGAITFCQGGSVTLTSNAASGNQWYKDGIAIGGSTATTLSVTTSGSYTTIVTLNGCSSPASNVIVVTVNPAPSAPILTAGGAFTFCQGGSVTLTSNAASGNQWYKDGIAIGGSTATTLNVTTTGNYTTIVTLNGCSSPVSNAIVVTVNPIPPAPTITAGGAITFCQGGSVTLTSNAASGNQWYKDGIAIGGSTAATLNVTTTGSYTTIVTLNGCSSLTSNAIVVTVNPTPTAPVITAGGAITFCQGGSVTLTSNAASGNQWYKDGIAIGGSTGTTFIANTSGSYTVNVTLSSCVSAISNAIAILVNPLPPTPTITASGNILQSSSLSGNQWFLNAAPISGANNQQYIAQSSGLYTVQVTLNGCNSISSGFNFIVTGIVNPSVWNYDVGLFPNPVNNNLYINNPSYRKLDIIIMDITGKIALRYNLNLSNGNINMEKLVSGAYFVSITDKQKNETIYKVIIKK